MTSDERREAADKRKARAETDPASAAEPRGARRRPARDAAQNTPTQRRDQQED